MTAATPTPVVTVIFERHGPHVAHPSYKVDKEGKALLDENDNPIPVDHPVDCGDCTWHWNILDTASPTEFERSNAGGSIMDSSDTEPPSKLAEAVKEAKQYFGKTGRLGELEQVNDNKWQIVAYDS